MTVIALLPIGGVPFLFSDQVMTMRVSPGGDPLMLPSGPTPKKLPDGYRHPQSTRRKLLWSDEQCVIGWSGALNQAEKLAKVLIDSAHGPPCDANIEKYLDPEVMRRDYDTLSLIGLLKTNGGCRHFVYESNQNRALSKSTPFDKNPAIAIGSGAKDFLDHVNGLTALSAAPLVAADIVYGSLCMWDMIGLTTYQTGFGGGYEYHYLHGEKLSTMRDQNLLFVRVTDEPGRQLNFKNAASVRVQPPLLVQRLTDFTETGMLTNGRVLACSALGSEELAEADLKSIMNLEPLFTDGMVTVVLYEASNPPSIYEVMMSSEITLKANRVEFTAAGQKAIIQAAQRIVKAHGSK